MAATATKPRGSAVAGATVALVLLTAMNFVNYLDRYILPAVQEQVKGQFHLSDEQIGSLTMWFFVAYVLSSPVTGWLGDRFPRKPMIVIAALAIAAMNFWTASVHSYMSLNLRHAALGVGEASFGIFAPALLADYFAEDQRNAVLTVFNVAIPVGAALGYLAGGMIGHAYGWRMAFVASAIPGAVIAVLILVLMKEPKRGGGGPTQVSESRPGAPGSVLPTHADGKAVVMDGAPEHGVPRRVDTAGVLSLLKNRAYLCSILGYAAVTFSLGGISWWMVSFLQRMNGFSQDKAGTVMGGITVVCGLGGRWRVVGAVVVEADAQGAVPGARAERAAGGAAGGAVLLWACEMDAAGAGRGGVSYLSGDGAGECRHAERGAGQSARDGDGGATVRDPCLWRCVFAEDHRDGERPLQPALWAGCDADYVCAGGRNLLDRIAVCAGAA